jgi:hypothetical protein
MDDLKEHLASTRIKDDESSIDWLSYQTVLTCFLHCHTINIGIVHKLVKINPQCSAVTCKLYKLLETIFYHLTPQAFCPVMATFV